MIRDPATQAQVDAADPGFSTWLSANAGSGKTRVLTDRVARLLLAGTDPQNVLCLTYTKAAASEMQNRLFKRLGDWAMKPAANLAEELRGLGVEGALDPAQLREARRLFARAIEAPGGLRIQTIHSFCAGLLRRFPLEAGISPQFREMEDRAAELMRAEVIEEMSLEVPDLVRGLVRYVTDDDSLEKLLKEIVGNRGLLARDPGDWRGVLGLGAGLDEAALLSRIVGPGDRAMLAQVAQAAATGSVNDQRLAAKIAGLPDVLGPGDLVRLEGVCLTGAFTVPKSMLTKATAQVAPDLAEALTDLAQRVEAHRPDRLALAALRRTEALHAFAEPFLARYAARKQAGGWLDFDDLIGLANRLLGDPRVAAWVLFRLDGGIDHILVDEAQDTSPAQWRVIRALAAEFSAGSGAQPDRARTIFVVGDKKQSIYSFQGADPAQFDAEGAHYEAVLEQAGLTFQARDLTHSFRSSEAVLRAVDATFLQDGTGVGPMRHVAFKDAMPGRVDLWPLIEKEAGVGDEGEWYEPIDRVSAADPKVVLAGRIAARIRAMIDGGETVPVETGQTGTYGRRPLHEGDILILTRGREPGAQVSLFSEIIAACKKAGLAVAGADRMKVGAQLAVRDIASLLRFLALPEDDLSLAEALRSPLFGLGEGDLYALAQPRGRRFLWEAFRESAAHPEARAMIGDLLREADFLRPYDLVNRILTRHDGRRRLLARLGPEAEDGIDALLAQALGYERSEVPGLTGFLEWMATDALEIKRQAESAGRRIRVMTVHGAKGLEAPVVILPDTHKRKSNLKDRLYFTDGHAFYGPPAAELPPVLAGVREGLKEREEEEARRLLYVAMTRAQSWLIVCGHGDAGKEADGWHGLVEAGLAHLGAVDAGFPTGPGRRYAMGDWDAGEVIDAPAPGAAPTPMADLGAVEATGATTATRTPSDLGGAKVLPGDPAEVDRETALERGTLVHLLLEHLPQAEAGARAALGLRIAAGAEVDLLPGEATELVADVVAMIAAPELAAVFAAGGLREVEVTGELPGIGRLHGAIDRLIVADDIVTAIDYKSNRLIPERPEEIPEGILRQLAAYAALLAPIWPGRRIGTAVLWTAQARLMPVPADLTDAALRRAGAEAVRRGTLDGGPPDP